MWARVPIYLRSDVHRYYKDIKRVEGGAFDIHKAIRKLPKPKKGCTLPGPNNTGPHNPLEK